MVLTTKLKADPIFTKGVVSSLGNFETVLVDAAIINDAIDCSIVNKISFRDGLIIAAASSARCDVVLSEDLSHRQVIDGIRVQNPFADAAIS